MAKVTIHRTIITKKQGCCAAACTALMNAGTPPQDKVVEVTHDGDATLTITQAPEHKGAAAETFAVKPGAAYTVTLNEDKSFEEMVKLIKRWTFSFEDGRTVTAEEKTTRRHEDDEVVSK